MDVGSVTEQSLAGRLIEVVRMRDPDLADHGQRAAHIAAAIGMELGLPADETDRAYLGAQLHDVGKLGVVEAVLWKPAGLTRSEWAQIRTHPEKGFRLVSDIVHRDVAAAVLSHHERIDGAGYPHGVNGRTLPVVVRIIQVADAYDAMTSVRPYQGAMSAEYAVNEIRRCAGTQFDPDVAAALGRLLAVALHEPDSVDLRTRTALSAPADPFAATG
jgi:HD-GYP domain-containing protein (c-di-GMP phosphodiesterase class II)